MRSPNFFIFGLVAAAIALFTVQPVRADQTPQPLPTDKPEEIEPVNTLFQLEPLFKFRYYYQANIGKGKAQYRVTYGVEDKKHHNEYSINIPLVTKYTDNKPPKTGLAQIFLYAAHVNTSEKFDHSVAAELYLPTVTNNANSNDTEVRALYGLRWIDRPASLTMQNTFAQSVSVPPGSSWTSYYDLKLAAAPHVGRGTFAVFYESRVLFTQGGTYTSAVGPNIVTALWKGATLNAFDIWGIGANGQTNLWRYRVQANFSQRI